MFKILQDLDKNILLLIFFVSLQKNVSAKPIEFINALDVGLSEKGFNFNLIKDISNNNQATFGVHFFEGNISTLKYSLIEPVPILFSSKGIQFSIKHFLKGNSKKTGLFAQLGLDISSLKATSMVDLGNQVYDLGNFTMTCRTCGDITIRTENNFQFIPSFLLGYQKQINDNFSFTLAAGIQSLNIPTVEWEGSNSLNYPSYVREKIDKITDQVNKELGRYGKIYPTVKLSTTFHF